MNLVRVVTKELLAEGVVRLVLAAVDGEPLPAWTPGSHIDLVIDGVTVKQYSLCGDPAVSSTYTIGVLLDENGSGASRYIHHTLNQGDVVQVRGPRNHFALAEAPAYVFIAGGIGITPILPMIQACEAAGRPWRLYYGGRQRASMAFLDSLATYNDRVEVIPQDERGHLPLDAILGSLDNGALVYCCGPEPLLQAVEQHISDLAEEDDILHLERFAPRQLEDPVRSESFVIELAQSGIELEVQNDESILDVVQRAGVDMLYSCREGTCGTCEVSVLGGAIEHRDSVLSASEREEGDTMMICVSRARGARLILDL
jgi:ferredoxin-NADP reductase